MTNFDFAFLGLMELEGFDKLTNDVVDHGGTTKYGISLRFLQSLNLIESDLNKDGHVNEKDIALLTETTAKEFTKKYFWEHYLLDKIVSQQVSEKLLQIFFNMRGQTATKVLQRAIRSHGIPIVEDGLIGKDTINKANSIKNDFLLPSLRSEQACIYRLIVQADKTQEKFIKGWLKRAYT